MSWQAAEYYWGDSSPVCQVGARLGAPIDENANFETGMIPVGGSDPNEFGLYDMAGNAWEWVQDPFSGEDYISSPSYVSFLADGQLEWIRPGLQTFCLQLPLRPRAVII